MQLVTDTCTVDIGIDIFFVDSLIFLYQDGDITSININKKYPDN